MYNGRILQVALSQIGIKEAVGKEDNPEVLKYFEALGYGSLHDETAWCSAFVNWVAIECGLEFSGKLTARSWLNIGWPVYDPEPGDLVIYWRESINSWKGHVGFFCREYKGWIYTLGGNQNNQVNIKAYPSERLLAYRKLGMKDIA